MQLTQGSKNNNVPKPYQQFLVLSILGKRKAQDKKLEFGKHGKEDSCASMNFSIFLHLN